MQQSTISGGGKLGLWPMACLVLGAGLAWSLVGTLRLPLIDRDEGWHAEIARQMVHTGDWLLPNLPAWPEKSALKPPLAMWLIALSFKSLGVSEVAARLPSVLCTALTGTLLFVACARRWGRAAGLAAAAWMVLPLLPAVAGRMALTDPPLVLLATIVLLCLERSLRTGGSTACNATMWIAVGLAGLTKGPAILAFLGPALVLTADRPGWSRYLLFVAGVLLAEIAARLATEAWAIPAIVVGAAGAGLILFCLARWIPAVLRLPIGILWGLPLAAILCGWWFVYVATASPVLQQSVRRYIVFEVLTRFITPIEGHFGPPGYYVLVAAIGLLPFSAAVPRLLRWAFRTSREEPAVRLLLGWVIGSWLLWEVVTTKLPHYLLPAMPALAMLAGYWWSRDETLTRRAGIRGALSLAWPVLLLAALIVALTLGLAREGFQGTDEEIRPVFFKLLAAVAGIWAGGLLIQVAGACAGARKHQQDLKRVLVTLAGGWAVAAPVPLLILGLVCNFYGILSHDAAYIATRLAKGQCDYYALGYTEPSLFFYLPPDTYHRIKPRDLPELSDLDEPFILIVNKKHIDRVKQIFRGRLKGLPAEGINPAKARWEEIFVCKITPRRAGPSPSSQPRVRTGA